MKLLKRNSLIALSVLLCQCWPAMEPAAAAGTQSSGSGGEDCADERPAGIIALVNGAAISREQADELIQEDLIELRERLGKARGAELYLEINSRLLEAEAAKAGIQSADLLQREVDAKVTVPTEADARALYEANRAKLGADFSAVKEQLLAYIHRQRRSEKSKELAERLRAAARIEVLIEDLSKPEPGTEENRVAARIDGEAIPLSVLDGRLETLLFQMDEKIYEIRKNAVEKLIDQTLIDAAARQKGVSADKFLDAVIREGLEEVSELEVRRFYDRNRERLDVDYRTPEGRSKIIELIQERELDRRKGLLIDYLRKNAASIEIYLEAPALPPAMLVVDDQPAKGTAEAPITIVEFIDYECSNCAALAEVIDALLADHPEELRVVVRDFPLKRHQHAYTAALAAEAAREQGKYWEYARMLFENQHALEAADLKEYAGRLGLDRQRFDAALDSGKFADLVDRDRGDALRLGLVSTPSVFVNGRRITGRTRADFEAAIEKARRSGASGR